MTLSIITINATLNLFHAIQVMVKRCYCDPYDLCKSTMTRKSSLLQVVTFEKILILIASLFGFFLNRCPTCLQKRSICLNSWTLEHWSGRYYPVSNAKRLYRHSAKEAFTVTALLRREQLITEEMPQGRFCLSCFSTAQSAQ